MKVVAFDLSTRLIGVAIGQFNEDGTFKTVQVLPIVPEQVNGHTLGFTTKNRKKIELRDGSTIRTFLKEGELTTTKTEAKRRDTLFREMREIENLRNIGTQIGFLLHHIKPDLILVERNEQFNAVKTTKRLGEVAGGLYFYSGMFDIPLKRYSVHSLRATLDREIPGTVMKDGKVVVDVKMAVKLKLEMWFESEGIKVKGMSDATTDESDALLVLWHYYKTEQEKRNQS